jgi:hypothetical protein
MLIKKIRGYEDRQALQIKGTFSNPNKCSLKTVQEKHTSFVPKKNYFIPLQTQQEDIEI